jgi:hypothetical protein
MYYRQQHFCGAYINYVLCMKFHLSVTESTLQPDYSVPAHYDLARISPKKMIILCAEDGGRRCGVSPGPTEPSHFFSLRSIIQD